MCLLIISEHRTGLSTILRNRACLIGSFPICGLCVSNANVFAQNVVHAFYCVPSLIALMCCHGKLIVPLLVLFHSGKFCCDAAL